MNTSIQKYTVGTHDGAFHADEVTACALLVICGLVKETQVIRSRDPEKLNLCEYVCDVGGIYEPNRHLFDHHQASYKGSLSSAGMVLKFLMEQKYISSDEYHLLNNSLIQGVDAHDNGVEVHIPGVCTYSQLISNFMPINHNAAPQELDAAFQEALHFAIEHLYRLIKRHRYIHSFKPLVQNAMSEYKECLIFDQAIPWMDCFFALGGEQHPATFIIMPSGNHWKLRGIPPNAHDRMKVRIPLPDKWAGLLDNELQKVTGIEGAIFCHKGRFFSLWNTRQDALVAFEMVKKMKGE